MLLTNGEDVKIVGVLEASGCGISGGKELVSCVFDGLVLSVQSILCVKNNVNHTRVVIHSRACTVPCHTTPFFEPLPPVPQMWMPLMSRPSLDLPAEMTSALLGYAAARSVSHWRWSANGWYALNHVALGAAPADFRS